LIASLLMAISAAIILMLGTVHLVLTFHGSKLQPREPSLQVEMKRITPNISRETTMWKAWIGFNVSHSLCAILFGLLYGYFAIAHSDFLFQSGFLLAVGFCLLASLVVLGKVYWFSIPFRGISLSFACYVGSIIAAWR